MDTLELQNDLQKRGSKIIEELKLEDILSRYGEFKLVGSIKYGLMTWRDIDIDLVTEDEPEENGYWEIVRTIFPLEGIRKLSLIDDRKQDDMNRPKSLYLGGQYIDKDKNTWKIDIRILSKKSVVTDKTEKLIEEKMTQSARDTILQIKSQVCDHPKYHKEFFSVDIYESVLIGGAKDLDDFKNYLARQNKFL